VLICTSLSERFDRRLHSMPDEQLKVRIQIKISCNTYAALSLLEGLHLDDPDIAWDGARGWLDEIPKVARQRVFEAVGEWSSSENIEQQWGRRRRMKNETEAARDVNSDPYMSEWLPLGGRDVSVTLGNSDIITLRSSDRLNQGIDRIEKRAYPPQR